MALAAGIAGLAMAALLVAVTVLPLSSSKAWWVRMWDFPRLQIAIATLAAAALSLLGPWPWLTLPALAACLGYQLWRIRPYTPLTRTEIEFAQGEGRGRDVRLLAANVLMENEAHDKVIAFVEAQDPDILLLMETDARWVAALEPVLARYPTVLRQPRDDYYGLVFATRLPAATARTLRLTLDDTPAVRLPLDVNAWVAALQRALEQGRVPADARARILARWSWDAAADAVIAACRDVATVPAGAV